MKRKLGDLAIIVKSKDSVEKIDRNKYVTTENMISNRGGVSFPSSTVPKQKKLDMFDKDDVLVSNIRPYFKKIWKASFSGYKSGDVLAFRTKDRDILSQEYLYILLESDRFFEYMTTTAKGTKMPRGDKKAIAEFPFDLPSIDIQKKRSHQIEVIEQKIRLNQQINANLTNQLNSMFDKMYYESSSRIELMNFVSEMKSGDWGKAKSTDNFIKPATIIRGTDFCNVANGQKSDAPIRYLKTATIQKKHLIANDVLIEISGGSPTQSTGRSLLITDKLLNRYNTPVLGTNFTRLFRCETEENAVLFHSYINFLYNKNVFFNYENGTTGIKNLDYKSILKINVNDVQKHSLFPKYFSMYHFYESMKQHLGDESTVLTCLKEQLLRKFF